MSDRPAAPAPFRCADAARQRGDAIGGSAPRGSYWVLIEHRGGWPRGGFDGLDLDPHVASEVFSAAQALRARILLIRRHGRRSREGPGRWAVMRLGGPGGLHQIWGTWQDDADLREISEALQRCSETGSAGSDDADPVILVCTHGQHDACCAIRGRPVAAALSERWPDLVWECSHVGGDRFAASILVVPDGVYYGNLDAESASDVIDQHRANRIRADHLRGYTDLAPVEQVAVAAALDHNGPAGRFDYTASVTSFDDDMWTVRVRGRLPHHTDLDVDLSAVRTAPHQLTCRGAEKASALDIIVRAVRPASVSETAT